MRVPVRTYRTERDVPAEQVVVRRGREARRVQDLSARARVRIVHAPAERLPRAASTAATATATTYRMPGQAALRGGDAHRVRIG